MSDETIQVHGEFADPLGGGHSWCVQCVPAADCSTAGLYIKDNNGDTVVFTEFPDELRELRNALTRALVWAGEESTTIQLQVDGRTLGEASTINVNPRTPAETLGLEALVSRPADPLVRVLKCYHEALRRVVFGDAEGALGIIRHAGALLRGVEK